MLLPYLEVFKNKKLILGSQSKSRNQIMLTQKVPFEKCTSNFPQDLDKTLFTSASAYNLQTCKGKVKDLLDRFHKTQQNWDILICADTIIEYQSQIIQKPIDQKDCIEMMGKLSNNTHNVYTAHIITFNTTPQIQYQWVTKAYVTFGDVPKQALIQFSKTAEPYIHSGGYELTAISGSFIKSLQGSFSAVQGLDIYEVSRKIIEGMKEAKWI